MKLNRLRWRKQFLKVTHFADVSKMDVNIQIEMEEKEVRLIDADALDKDLRKYAERKAAGGHIEIASGVLSAAERIRQCAPTVDAVPVVHGHWIHQNGYGDDLYYTCSACGCDWLCIEGTPEENNMRYCPECGTKMDDTIS